MVKKCIKKQIQKLLKKVLIQDAYFCISDTYLKYLYLKYYPSLIYHYSQLSI